jgi:adenosylcobyric acid synthase
MSALMIQGTGSHVGKSFIVAGLCRVFKNKGISVAPFKSQNMALNSFATVDGLEMGRAQAVQAAAAGIEPSVSMNPILLKPTSDRRAQVIVRGKPLASMNARTYHERKKDMLAVVVESLGELDELYEALIIEGAGSPAEINLADQDIANMAVARLANAPVVLVADIDRGGAFASLCGTLDLLPPDDRDRVRGFIINKFRGDLSLLQPGLDFLEAKTGRPVLGVVPHTDVRLEEEDSVSLDNRISGTGALVRVAVPLLPRLSNFTDFQPLETTEGVHVHYVRSVHELGRPDAVIVPGSKNTLADLEWLKRSGLAAAIVGLAARDVPVIGICGGFQMLGRGISDPLGIEGPPGSRAVGLELLSIDTELRAVKTVGQVTATVLAGADIFGEAAAGARVKGYEIHAGVTSGGADGKPFAGLPEGRLDGWVAEGRPVAGSYFHGLFDNEIIRRSFTELLAKAKGVELETGTAPDFEERIEKIALLLEESLDIDAICRLLGPPVAEGAPACLR